MDVYFDNTIVSAIAKRDTPAETEAIVRVLRADAAGRLRLWTSEVTKEEIDRYEGEAKPTVEAIYLLMKKANYVKRQELLLAMNVYISPRPDMSYIYYPPLMADEPLWKELMSLGLDHLDAHHLMIAVRAGCKIFLTNDGDFLDRHRGSIEAQYNIRVRRPSEFVVDEGL